MTLDEYQKQALTTAKSTGDEFKDLVHWAFGVSGEAGEVAEKMKKIIRDDKFVDGQIVEADKIELSKEIGDVLWYLAILANELGVKLSEIGDQNLAKLKSRKERDAIGGSGDNR